MPLRRRRDAFDHPDWIFELKYDGFRALCIIQPGRGQLISRNGNPEVMGLTYTLGGNPACGRWHCECLRFIILC